MSAPHILASESDFLAADLTNILEYVHGRFAYSSRFNDSALRAGHWPIELPSQPRCLVFFILTHSRIITLCLLLRVTLTVSGAFLRHTHNCCMHCQAFSLGKCKILTKSSGVDCDY